MVNYKGNGNHHQAALWKCKLLTVTSQNRFSDRARGILCRSRALVLSPASGIVHSAIITSTAWGLRLCQCEAVPCAALVLWATGTIESSAPYPNRPSHLLTSFDQPSIFPNPLEYCVHYLLVLGLYLTLGESLSYCVGLWIGLRGDRAESYSRSKMSFISHVKVSELCSS